MRGEQGENRLVTRKQKGDGQLKMCGQQSFRLSRESRHCSPGTLRILESLWLSRIHRRLRGINIFSVGREAKRCNKHDQSSDTLLESIPHQDLQE
jgi:hypothetical protein